jgi:hypothetical protein
LRNVLDSTTIRRDVLIHGQLSPRKDPITDDVFSVYPSSSIAPTVMLGVLLLSACQPLTPDAHSAGSRTDAAAGASATATAEPAGEALATEVATGGLAPAGLAIPALGLEIPVVPMAWEAVELDGQHTTQWVLPEDAAGWALNSAGAGEAGNVVIAGYQARGDAVFAALALGEVEPGQDILITDEAGAEFIYRVVELSEPLPLLGATEEEQAQANVYIAPTADAAPDVGDRLACRHNDPPYLRCSGAGRGCAVIQADHR